MCAYRTPRSTRDTSGLQRLVTPVARPNPVVVAWRWRYELGAATSLGLVLAELDHVAGVAGLVVVAVTATGAAMFVGAWPPARRLAAARLRCVVTPHRIRTGCAQAWVHTRYGKIPIVVWTSARPFGERVWVWCRAGTATGDLESARDQLIAACWAQDVRITAHPRFAHLAAIDVVRRSAWLGQTQSGPLWAVPERPQPQPDGQADTPTWPLTAFDTDKHGDAA